MKWILLKDSKPSHGDNVLIAVEPTVANPKVYYEIFFAVVEAFDEEIIFRDKWGFCETFKMTVHSWMLVPKPPENPIDKK